MKCVVTLALLTFVVGCSSCSAAPTKQTQQPQQPQAVDMGKPAEPTVEVKNIFLYVGKTVPQGTLHWQAEGKIVVNDLDKKCGAIYGWKDGKLVEEKRECQK